MRAFLPVLVPVGVAAAALAAFWYPPLSSGPILRWSLLGLSLAFVAYALQRQLGHRRMSSELSDERVLSTAYANRVRDLSALVSMVREVGSALELDDVLRILLDEALDFFQGRAGSIMMLDGAGFLQTARARGNDRAMGARLRLGDSVAGHVALTREPLLVRGRPSPKRFRHLVDRDDPVESAMCVPLINRNELLGVLNLNANPQRPFSDHDLQLLSVFAGQAAIAIANARVLFTERTRRSELAELNRMKSDLIATIGRDLRGPLAAFEQQLDALRRRRLHDQESSEIVREMERSLVRITASVDRLFSEADLAQDERTSSFAEADLEQVALSVAQDFERDGRSLVLEVEGPCLVTGEEGLLQQVLWNLLDNAFKYGAPPVTVQVRLDGDNGLLSVTDKGPGIAPGERELIFRRFSRGGRNGPQGMGLGLSIVHGIVSACGGRVWADDADGGGAVFHVALPLSGRGALLEHAKEVRA